MDDPLKVVVRGGVSPAVDLACGAQDVPITVGYVAAVDAQRNTAGHIRLLDYSR